MKLTLEEKERRYARVKEGMESENLSALLVVSNAQINQQGFVRYFTNLSIPIYSHGLLFTVAGEAILLTPSPLQTYWAKELSWIPRENVQMAKSLGEDFGKLLIRLKLHDKKIGVINYRTLTMLDFRELMQVCPRIQLTDSTGMFERIRSVKSEEEINCVKEAINVGVIAHRTFHEEMIPGISEMALIAKVEESIRCCGAERSFYLMTSQISDLFPHVPGSATIGKESPVLFSVEASGPGGYWSQLVRTYFWEKPRGTLEKLHRTLLDLRSIAREELRPGKKVKDVAERLRAEIGKNGFDYGIHFGHGLGLDVVEEPIINTENECILGANHFVAIHPHLIDRKASLGVWLGDMYFVGEEETEILTPLAGLE
jgi:Xaa-Pro aminopeptidase